MFPSLRSFALLAFLPLLSLAAEPPRVCTVHELHRIRLSTAPVTDTLLATGTVQSLGSRDFILSDATGYTQISTPEDPLPVPGTIVRVLCSKARQSDHDKRLNCREWKALGSAPVTPPLRLRLNALDEQRHDLRRVTVEGTVIDIVPDEVDSKYDVLLLKDGAATLPCFIRREKSLHHLQDASIQVTGVYHRLVGGLRRFSGPYLEGVSDFSVLEPAPADLLNAPPIDPSDYMTPKDVAAMERRSLAGTVLATWNGNQAMLRVRDMVVNVAFANGRPLPPCGAAVRVAGYPGTDLYRLVLSKCVWAETDGPHGKSAEEPITDVTPRQILLDHAHTPQINSDYHGQLVRLQGIVRALPGEGSADRRLLIDSDGFRVPVDFRSNPSAADGVSLGCRIEVTGRCLMQTESWKPYEAFPQISGFAVVLRTPADLHVLATPSWWTPLRLLIVIAALFAALVAILVWNRVLNRLVERSARQLFRAETAQARSEFRIDERTNLAVELHDAISQNLTGVALEINIAGRKATTNLPVALEHLGLAQKTLASCRQELRNCLWDLRNNALDASSMDEAIRQTLAPHLGEAKLAVRFSVRRERLSDNTAHAILRIIRELTVNAVRHGQAQSIRVAGSIENGQLLFSVSDDGRGFEPTTVPGVRDGHFGLQGIRERVRLLGGSFEIGRRTAAGMKAVVRLPVPRVPKEEGK